jgi:hypothetical protein
MAIPMRLFMKNQVKTARNAIDTITPATCTGGMTAVQMTIGSSPIGSGSALVCAPTVIGGRPRRIAASPMVAMMTATTGRPSSGRSTERSSRKLSTIMPITAAAIAAQIGRCAESAVVAMKPASMTNSPWAKLIASVAL